MLARLPRCAETKKPPLFAEAQPCDHVPVAVHVAAIKIAQLPPAPSNELQQPAARVVVVLVRLQVLREVNDPLGQHCNLHLRRTCVALMRGERFDDVGLALFGKQPFSCVFLCLLSQRVTLAHDMNPGNKTHHPRPALVLLSGLPATGKTTFAARLASRLPIVAIESDAVRRELVPQPSYTSTESARVFDVAEARVHDALLAGRHALLDATNLTARDRGRFLACAAQVDATVLAVRLTAPIHTVRQRMGRPREGHSQAGFDVYLRMRERPQPFNIPVVVVDSRFDIGPSVELVAALITRGS